jgi:hypothetical protein
MVPVMPSLVERRIQRRFSAARMRTISRCCIARGALAEVAVVGDVEQHFRAVRREAPHEIGEDGFVADEGAQFVTVDGRDDHCLPGVKSPASVVMRLTKSKGHGTNSPKGTRLTLS